MGSSHSDGISCIASALGAAQAANLLPQTPKQGKPTMIAGHLPKAADKVAVSKSASITKQHQQSYKRGSPIQKSYIRGISVGSPAADKENYSPALAAAVLLPDPL